MKLERKMLRAFGAFTVIAGLCLGLIYCIISGSAYLKERYAWTSQTANWTADRFEDVVNRSKSAYTILIADPDNLRSMQVLAKDSEELTIRENIYFSDSYSTIRDNIDIFFVYESFYRILFYNQKGDVITGNNPHEREINPSLTLGNFPDLASMKQGEFKILPCQSDRWGRKDDYVVLSFVKRLVGDNMGYIEVQWRKNNLDDMLCPGDSNYDIVMYDQDGVVLYSNQENDSTDFFNVSQMQKKREGIYYLNNENTIVAYITNEETGVITVIAEEANIYGKMISQILPILIILLLVFFGVAAMYIRLATKQLMKPISALRSVMERTDLANMTEVNNEMENALHSSEEVAAMYLSFDNMLQRLSSSIDNEKHLSVLQLQAQFDLLQAQVNPHFLYNVLNIISAKGMMANEEEICDICSCLGRMLRYSTNTKTKMGAIREEKEYLQMYFTLLKYRYEHHLEYKIDIDEVIESEVLPKIILQQFVENSVKHGYSEGMGVIKIYVTGKGTEDNWYLKVYDNGSGFEREKIEELKQQMAFIRKRLSNKREHVEMEIGGMGLLNTYVRLYLVYGNRMSMQIFTDKDGTEVGFSVRKWGKSGCNSTEC